MKKKLDDGRNQLYFYADEETSYPVFESAFGFHAHGFRPYTFYLTDGSEKTNLFYR